ncbi:MAG TPA: MoaD/ThiS family protein [Bacillota bacterium]|nr:MoaD/ThiS family protein [Bacillota bacterium]HOB87288.1 MoaD/ThiS family protein [Bacillota bacterium]HOP69034.1 MoaD/ThiS family protein [Bacillota bacterium]HPT33666.1 MoaD/ThiS family protein [Bacillota bacterium]HPZ65364.1 MoaD/ThiS family protein [Bacillota bacterium]
MRGEDRVSVNVKFLSLLGRLCGEREVVLELERGATLGMLLAVLAERYPLGDYLHADSSSRSLLQAVINGKPSHNTGGPETVLEDGDQIVLYLTVGGG